MPQAKRCSGGQRTGEEDAGGERAGNEAVQKEADQQHAHEGLGREVHMGKRVEEQSSTTAEDQVQKVTEAAATAAHEKQREDTREQGRREAILGIVLRAAG